MNLLKFIKFSSYVILITCQVIINSNAQFMPAGHPIVEEYFRREQISGTINLNNSFTLRPLLSDYNDILLKKDSTSKSFNFGIIPVTTITRFNSNRPNGFGDFGMIPSNGFQQYVSGGFYAKLGFIHIQIQPEFIAAQNSSFQGFSSNFSPIINTARFLYFNYGDSPERFGDGGYNKIFFGQSSFTLRFNAFEVGVSSKNIWWGPGQWNSLTFSNNSPGFPHITINTHKPARTFFGDFEFQLLIGRLEDSGFQPTQFEELNSRYFTRFNGDWKYLNALMFGYAPKWVPNLHFGITRTFQRYSSNNFSTGRDYFPVFEGLQKINFFENRNTVVYDGDGYDQQFTAFTRFFNKKAKAEVYFEYGRRDHPFNWRELILNPEHARAFILGFQKLFSIKHSEKFIQLRGEITNQQESINRIIRYSGLLDGNSWHTHYQARGFTNYGQALGVGIGTGSNVQTFEISLVDKFNKVGLLFERLENHQDFYYRAFGQQNEYKPWIDLSMGFLFDHRWDNLLLSSKVQLINGFNYQWQLDPKSTPDFPKGKNLFSVHSQVSLIYLPKGLKRSQRNLSN